MKTPLLLLAAAVALATAASAQTSPRYNQIQQKHSHNTYQRHESLMDQLLYYSVRSIELDIHSIYYESPVEIHVAPKGDWAVYHTDTDTGTHTTANITPTPTPPPTTNDPNSLEGSHGG